MKYLAAYLLAELGGNDSPSAGDLKKILSAVGIDPEEEELKKVVGSLEGKTTEELITEGRSKMSSVPVGGGGAAVGSAAPGTAGGDAPAAAKEEEKEEEEEESDEDMGFGLFD
eukprot:TRINITY_DN50069_c0_g1_i1.p1 TRINITY_DN50069_c0_g1~~TRINITY_DN50069_c0_g1_i1.p1  ORF type:complete len:113 (+),score=41.85 TRINITY_DN50069_c0_g1_i1:85-423(+)